MMTGWWDSPTTGVGRQLITSGIKESSLIGDGLADDLGSRARATCGETPPIVAGEAESRESWLPMARLACRSHSRTSWEI